MPVTSMSDIQQLSNFFTYEMICSEIMVRTNTIDNEKVQLANIRTHVNMAISYLANLLNLASSPWYMVWMRCRFENTLHPTGLYWINLMEPVSVQVGGNTVDIVPGRWLNEIKRSSLSRASILPGGNQQYKGNVIKVDLAQIAQLDSYENVQWRHSIAWTHTGNEVLVFAGQGIAIDAVKGVPVPESHDYIVDTNASDNFMLWGTRYPFLDDMLPPASSTTYRFPVDIPEKYVDLLVKLGVKATLEQLSMIPSAQLDQEINQGIATITSMLQTDLQLEQANYEKRKYGQQQRPPGAV